MSENPVLGKMEALMKKHRGDAGSACATPAGTVTAPVADAPPQAGVPANVWLPVLNQVIERGTPPPKAATATTSITPPAPDFTRAPAVSPASAAQPETSAPVIDTLLAEQLMKDLAPRLSEVMEKQVAAELRKNIDQTVSTLLSELDVSVREIVRDAIAAKLNPPNDPST